jgi:ribosomal protein L4
MSVTDKNFGVQTGALTIRKEGTQDVIEFFAERGMEVKQLKEKVKEAERKEQLLKENLESSKADLHTLQVRAATPRSNMQILKRQTVLLCR